MNHCYRPLKRLVDAGQYIILLIVSSLGIDLTVFQYLMESYWQLEPGNTNLNKGYIHNKGWYVN
jgi:hypothetical protein